jgi:hypothetical protein
MGSPTLQTLQDPILSQPVGWRRSAAQSCLLGLFLQVGAPELAPHERGHMLSMMGALPQKPASAAIPQVTPEPPKRLSTAISASTSGLPPACPVPWSIMERRTCA